MPRRTAAVAAAVAVLAGCGGGGEDARDGGDGPAVEPWRFARAMSLRRSYVAAAQVGDAVYVAGGMVGDSGRFLGVFQRFDAPENRWTTLSRLPEPVRAGAGAAVGGTFYVIGGQTAAVDDGRQVYAYDIDRRAWRAAAPLPEPRFNHSAVAAGGRILVLGGYAGGEEQDEVFAYDAGSDRWTLLTRLPEPMHAFGAVVFRDEVWVVGGRRGEEILDRVWILDLETHEWREGPSMPKPMELLGTAVVGDEIHAVWESVYQIYDAGTGRWRQGPVPNVTRHGVQAFHVDGGLYTIGGCTTELRDSPVVERRDVGAGA